MTTSGSSSTGALALSTASPSAAGAASPSRGPKSGAIVGERVVGDCAVEDATELKAAGLAPVAGLGLAAWLAKSFDGPPAGEVAEAPAETSCKKG